MSIDVQVRIHFDLALAVPQILLLMLLVMVLLFIMGVQRAIVRKLLLPLILHLRGTAPAYVGNERLLLPRASLCLRLGRPVVEVVNDVHDVGHLLLATAGAAHCASVSPVQLGAAMLLARAVLSGV